MKLQADRLVRKIQAMPDDPRVENWRRRLAEIEIDFKVERRCGGPGRAALAKMEAGMPAEGDDDVTIEIPKSVMGIQGKGG